MDINHIVKETLINLKKKSLIATPNNYHKEFCITSKKHYFTAKECKQFKQLVEKLNKSEQNEILKKQITTIEDMIPILLERVAIKNMDSLSSLLNSSLKPSISLELDSKLAKFSIQVDNKPSMIFEEDIQKQMQSFIEERYEADKKVVRQKTEDIAKLVTLMGTYLNDAINNHGKGGEEVASIKDKIQAIDLNDDGITKLSELQEKLISAAASIKDEMDKVGDNLATGKSYVNNLEEKVKKLEKELDTAKTIGNIDHLTGLLTRRAYETEILKLENNFSRNGNNYALIFLDLDLFKKVNDTYGHDAGDVVLSTFAKIIKSQTREPDIVARYGGEEFISVIQYNKKEELVKYLTRIKIIVKDNSIIYKKDSIHISFSAGVTLRNNHKTYESAIQKADVLLYEAKNSGRDKIMFEDGTTI